ncbi:hypothetical protein IXZ18_02105 [Campylobacter fetus subsp. venerealis bv. intermedius]|uniref:hypothetical protein n=1 Tax=Campylobacter fetus TaxID=196 RepID=UPI0026DEE352|nr:hypothetical protein [Campylobacter fetus]WKW29521.1 hypothetical protein IXZ18_02105 [Campylobacter fetus subsp. venerealis bv. intermedius]
MGNQKKVKENCIIRAVLAKEHEHIDIVTRKKEATENGFHFSIPNFFGKNGASLSSLNFKITEEEYSEEEDNLIRAMMALKHGKIFTRKKRWRRVDSISRRILL